MSPHANQIEPPAASSTADNPAPKKKRRRRRRLPKNFKPRQMEAFDSVAQAAVNTATKSKKTKAFRDLVMLQTIRYAGLRISELCNLRIEHMDLEDGEINVIHGKGDVDRNVGIHDKLLPVLITWIGDRKEGYLFPGRGDKPVSVRTFQRRLPALAKAAGFILTKENKANPHRLRHTFATALYKATGNLRLVQEALGHANLQTTAIYLHVEVDDLKEGINRI